MFDQINDFVLILAPVILGLMQVVKSMKIVDKKDLPFISLLIGVVLAVGFMGFHFLSVVIGLIASLVASGFYDVTKKSVLRK